MPTPISPLDTLCLIVSRLWLAGLAPRMPGTCGSAVALALAPFLFLPLPYAARCLLLVLIFVLGALASGRVEQLTGLSDPPEVVIDELLGMWLVLLPFKEPSLGLMLAAFVLFRIFDMLKPWPVSASEHWLPGGFGIMLDDAVAALLALACLGLLRMTGLL